MDGVTETKIKSFFAGSRTSIVISAVVVAAVLVSGLLLVLTKAAGFFAAVDPASGAALTNNAKVIQDSTAAGGNALMFTAPNPAPTPPPTPPTPPPPPPSGWPNASNTGYDSAPGYPGSVTPFTGTLVSNTTYSFKSFEPGFGVENVDNVTFYGCLFKGQDSAFANVVVRGSNNITFDYSSFVPKNYASPPASGQIPHNGSSQFGIWQYYLNPGKITIDHSEFWGWGNAIQFASSGDPNRALTVRNSWFHDARDDGGEDHTDAILQEGGNGSRYVTIHHNTIVSLGNTNGVGLQDQTVRDTVVTDNYFSGFGYTVAVGVGSTNTNVTFTGNTFGTDIKPIWGPLYGWPGGTGNLWRNNKWKVVPGSYYSPASDDGKYWWPDGSKRATDYTGG